MKEAIKQAKEKLRAEPTSCVCLNCQQWRKICHEALALLEQAGAPNNEKIQKAIEILGRVFEANDVKPDGALVLIYNMVRDAKGLLHEAIEHAEPSQGEIEAYVSASDGDISPERAREILIELHNKQAQPPAGELTKELRTYAELARQDGVLEEAKTMDEAADRLDAAEREKAKLKNENTALQERNHSFFEFDRIMRQKNAELEAENTDLKIRNDTLVKLHAIAQAENAKLKSDIWQTRPGEDGEGGLSWRQMATDLDMQIEGLKAENTKLTEQLANRECVAGQGGYCGYSQEMMNALVAERDKLKALHDTLEAKRKDLSERVEKLEKTLTEIRDAETECCHRCEGNGRVYADGKAHYMRENAPTIACPDCLGEGRIPTVDARDIAKQALAEQG